MEALTDLGYIGLFTASFLAATILPLSSEVVLSVLLLNGYNPSLSIGVATAGNVSGALLNYAIGLWGSAFLVQKVLRISQREMKNAQERFKKWGVISLFFAWVPVIGDPLTVIAGALKVRMSLFLLLVTAGKCMRYVLIYLAIK